MEATTLRYTSGRFLFTLNGHWWNVGSVFFDYLLIQTWRNEGKKNQFIIIKKKAINSLWKQHTRARRWEVLDTKWWIAMFVYAVSCYARTHLELVSVCWSPIGFHQLVTAFSRRWSGMEFQKLHTSKSCLFPCFSHFDFIFISLSLFYFYKITHTPTRPNQFRLDRLRSCQRACRECFISVLIDHSHDC